jgi:6-phosphogluconate dehydrogenase
MLTCKPSQPMDGSRTDDDRPSLSATTEYLKYSGGRQLPTQFMEAQLDYFGAHSYDLKCEGPGSVKKGKIPVRFCKSRDY